jgi:hypothetical protein
MQSMQMQASKGSAGTAACSTRMPLRAAPPLQQACAAVTPSTTALDHHQLETAMRQPANIQRLHARCCTLPINRPP